MNIEDRTSNHHYHQTISGENTMSRKLFALSSLAFLSVLPVLTASVQAQAQSNDQPTVTITNISGLERRALGGHKAKVSYKVTVPEKFKLKQVKGNIEFRLSDGSTQKGEYSTNDPKLENTIEITAPGKVLRVDQSATSIKANITAIADTPFKGFTTAKFKTDGSLISKQDGDANSFPLNIDILRISDFKRQALGGHQVKVQYNTPSIFGFTPEELRVKATFKLTGNQTQTNTVVKTRDIKDLGTELVDTDGKVFGADGETQQIDTQVAIDGRLAKSGTTDLIERCVGDTCEK